MEQKSGIQSKQVLQIVRNTLSRIDPRLVHHGERVAYIVNCMLRQTTKYTEEQRRKFVIGAIFHDIGAYKTEEIDRMVEFETYKVWEHSIYGYLFLREFTPLQEFAKCILYHHCNYTAFETPEEESAQMGLLLALADRVDMLLQQKKEVDFSLIERHSGTKFDPQQVQWLKQAEQTYHMIDTIQNGRYKEVIDSLCEEVSLTDEEILQYLKTLVYAIDFRSEYTVTHTINTVGIGVALAEILHRTKQEQENIYYGALLHDLGKITTPLSILESTGRLSVEEMEIMKKHVVVTEEIIAGVVTEEICNIAVRHHEKLDGSGYPYQLRKEVLTYPQRILAVSDVLSALLGKRSYKDAFSKEQVLEILLKEQGKIDGDIVKVVCEQYETILQNAAINSKEVLKTYQNMKKEMEHLLTILPKQKKITTAI